MPVIRDKIFAIRQYRYSVGQWALELPAGQIEEGESPEEAAVRELKEEIGCDVMRLTELGTTFPSIGCTSEKVYLFAAECTMGSRTAFDPTEQIEGNLLYVSEFQKAVERGELLCATNELAWRRYCTRNHHLLQLI